MMTTRLCLPNACRIDERSVDGIRVGLLTPEAPKRSCIAVMGFGAWLDPFEYQRFALLAHRLEARITIVETPGLGAYRLRASGGERRALLTGDYAPLARRMLHAGLAVAVPGGAEGVHLLGYSMGASLATDMAAAQLVPRLASLTLVEPVGAQTWNPLVLIRAIRREDRLIDTYLQETATVRDAVAPSDRVPGAPGPFRSVLDQILLPQALCWGRLGHQVGLIAQTGASLLVIHGTESQLSRPAAVDRLVQRARRGGVTATAVAVAGSHGIWQSLPRVAAIADLLSAKWDGR